MRSFRSKPVGWRGESYRHYLAAKGVTTKYFAALRSRLADKTIAEEPLLGDFLKKKAVSSSFVKPLVKWTRGGREDFIRETKLDLDYGVVVPVVGSDGELHMWPKQFVQLRDAARGQDDDKDVLELFSGTSPKGTNEELAVKWADKREEGLRKSARDVVQQRRDVKASYDAKKKVWKPQTTKFESNLLNRLRGTPRKLDFFEEHDGAQQKVKVVADIPDYLKKVPKKRVKRKKVVKKEFDPEVFIQEQLDNPEELREGVSRIKVPAGSEQARVKDEVRQKYRLDEFGLPDAKARARALAFEELERRMARREYIEFLDRLGVDYGSETARNKAVRRAIAEVEGVESAEKWTPEYLARKG